MKLPTSRTTSLSLAAVSVAFVCGMAVVSHQQAPVHLSGSYKTADASSPVPSSDPTTTPGTTTTAPSSTSTPTTTTSSSTQSAPSSSSSTNLSTSTPTTTQSTTTPALTTVSAVLQPWTDPVPTTSQESEIDPTTGKETPIPTEVQYEYCLYTYSDGSTQTTTIVTRWIMDGKDGMQTWGSKDCLLVNAPAAN